MIYRTLLSDLTRWKNDSLRKPLILKGARQVGKTTLVHLFSKEFDQYIYINLEKKEDREPFQNFNTTTDLINTISLIHGLESYKSKTTLLFIDEIQEIPEIINELRYFYEDNPELFVIAAGSLLDMALDTTIKIPVGRVLYLQVRPFSFQEFLIAMGENKSLQEINLIPLHEYAHSHILKLFHTYALIGGMPEIVTNYAKNRDILSLTPIFDSLLISYIDDIDRYASTNAQSQVLKYLINTFLQQAGDRIAFANFANSNYGEREIGECLRILEKNQLLQLIYPTTDTKLPISIVSKRKPKLQALDTGLLNYYSKIQHLLIGSDDLTAVYKGKVIEHLIGQELLTTNSSPSNRLSFWVREKANSNAEVDYVYSYQGKLIPIEVKAGKSGTLKSLHIFMSRANHNLAIRVYAGKLLIDKVKTVDVEYNLLNLPYFLISKIDEYLNWFIDTSK